MSGIDERGRTLAGAGALVGEGAFTIDGARARDRLRSHQLAAPHEYVLLLVRAAALAGASRVDFRIDSDDVEVAFDAAFPPTAIEELHAGIFREGGDPAGRARQELALALSAALALGPAFVRVESGDGRAGVWAELRADAPDRCERREGIAAGTRIWVRDRFHVRLVVEFVRNLGGSIAEAKVLRERCRWATLPIHLNGRRISGGLAGVDLAGRVTIAAAGIGGVAGFDRGEDGPATLDVLCGGVWMSREPLAGAPARARVWIDATTLATDLSQREVVRDAAWEAALGAARQGVEDAVAALAGEVSAGSAPAWAEGILRTWLIGKVSRGKLRRLDRRPELKALVELPLWRTTGGEPRSTRSLVDGAGLVGYTREEHGGLVPAGFPWVIKANDDAEAAFLAQALGERGRDVGPALAAMVASAAAERRFLARIHPGRLGAGYYQGGVEAIVGPGIGGEAAIAGIGSDRAEVVLVHRGAHLTTLHPEAPVAGVVAVIVGAFEPTPSFDGVVPEGRLVAALCALLRAIEAIVARLAAEGSRGDLVRTYVRWAIEGGHVDAVLAAAGLSKGAGRKMIEGDPTLAPVLESAPRWLGDPRLDPLTRAPIVRAGPGRERSLRELQAIALRRGSIPWVAARSPAPAVPDDVLLLDPGERRLCEAAFGRRALADASAEVARHEAEAAFLRRPQESLRATSGRELEVEWAGEGLRVALGVEASAGPGERIGVRVLRERRFVAEVELEAPIGGVRAVVDGPIRGDGEGRLGAEEAEAVARAVIDGALPALVDAAVDGFERAGWSAERARARVLLAAMAAAAGPALVRAAIAADGVAWATIAARASALGREACEVALARAGGDATATAAALERALAAGRGGSARPLQALCERVVTRLPELLGLPLIRLRGGGTTSLENLLRGGGTIDAVDEGLAEGPSFGRRIAALGRAERAALVALVGVACVVDRRGWLEDQVIDAALASRPALTSLGPLGAEALAEVAVDAEGLVGTIGVARAGAGGVLVCRGRRPVTRVRVELGVPVVGVLDAADLEVEVGLGELRAPALARVQAAISRRLGALLGALVGAWPGLSRADVDGAARWLVPRLAEVAAQVGEHPRRLAAIRPAGLAEVGLLPLADGRRLSLRALVGAYQEGGGLDFVRMVDPAARPGGVVLLLEDEAAEARVRALFPRLRDHAEAMARALRTARRRERAPAMVKGPPSDALVAVEVGAAGLEGWLWLEGPPAGRGITFGREGRVLGVATPAGCEGIWGAIEGGGVGIAGEWEGVLLGGAQVRALATAARALEDAALERHQAALAGEAEGLRGLREWLCGRLLALHRERSGKVGKGGKGGRIGKGGKRGRGGEDGKGGKGGRGGEGALYERLCGLPLFVVAGGRLVSLDVALEERPSELRGLGLWPSEVGDRERRPRGQDGAARSGAVGPASGGAVGLANGGKGGKGGKSGRAKGGKGEVVPAAELAAIEAVRAELRVLRRGDVALLGGFDLSRVRIDRLDGPRLAEMVDGSLVLGRSHPVIAALLGGRGGDPWLVSVAASASYGALVRGLAALEESHEAAFHGLHAAHLLSEAAGV